MSGPIQLAAVVAALALLLALTAPLQALLLLDLALVVLPGTWQVAGVRFDLSDVVLGCLFLGLLFRGRGRLMPLRKVPYLGSWLLLGVALSFSYLHAPQVQRHLDDPIRIAYQLYRYCWKDILYFPLCAMLFADRGTWKYGLLGALLAANLLSLLGTLQGYTTGTAATGPFTGSNLLAASIAPLLPIVIAVVVFPGSRFQSRLILLSALLIVRALLFAGARGGIVAAGAGCCFAVGILLTTREGRRKIIKLVPLAAAVPILILLLKPDLLQKPNLGRAFSASEGTKAQTMQWRIQRRWPHFWQKAWEKPWVGHGTPVDLTFGEAANTPHNGYLALAFANGFPALVLYLLFAVRALRNGLLITLRRGDPWARMVGVTFSGGLATILTNNLVESTLHIGFTAKLFWLFCALIVVVARQPLAEASKQPEHPAPRSASPASLPVAVGD